MILERSLEELNESIELLINYRDRLQKEVTLIGNKLQMPPSKINSTLKDSHELTNIDQTIASLISHRKKLISEQEMLKS